ncbi:sptzle 1B [Culex quinquefasciatus]|uniref:Sptzle 1B n=1 Tax=Culex quinquefasciatus TaxID=7176 RepID=B0X4M4_CULQU|nr:sptzle 1B [Culex quinquefasciatus]|eukprot:XP_001864596.1 sptzle 1B [Culex quinquefasciatus]
MAHITQLVIILLILVAILRLVDSAPNARPMVRQRVKPLVGLSNSRRKRPLQASDTVRDPNKSYLSGLNHRSTYDTNQHNTGDIYFPNDPPSTGPVRLEHCGPDFPICTNVLDYPQQLVNAIVARHEHRFAEVFGNDVVVNSGDHLDKRFDTSDDEFLCQSREKLVHPQSGYTMDKRLVMIVNTPSYTQGVRIETCANGGRSCHKLDHVLSFYRTECKQLYHYRTLLAIDTVTNQPYKESFRVPSCCKCVMKPLGRGSRYRSRG